MFTHDRLKDRHREIRDGLPQAVSLRTHRALSWLRRADAEQEDADARFIFLWIAFNAAYANEIHDRASFGERRLLSGFLRHLTEVDEDRLLYQTVWEQFPRAIRLLIDNRYVFQPFWDYKNGRLDEAEWQQRFQAGKEAAYRALGRMDTKKVLAIVFGRLYVLRNQLVHGGATWNSRVNRDQLRDGVDIMARLVPIVIHLMMQHPGRFIGEPCYPVVD